MGGADKSNKQRLCFWVIIGAQSIVPNVHWSFLSTNYARLHVYLRTACANCACYSCVILKVSVHDCDLRRA